MMRKAAATILVIILALVGGFYLVKNRVGDIRPSILPPEKKQSIAGEEANFLKVEGGLKIYSYATNLGQARDLEFTPQGTLLVSTPIQGKVLALVEQGGRVVPRDVITGLVYPHGIAFYKDFLYIAEETRVVRYKYDERNYQATEDKVLFEIPVGGSHVSRSIDFNQKGDLYLTIGSRCNACNESHPWIAAAVISDFEGKNPRLFSSGLRNAVFVKVHPKSQKVWVTEMGRDFLGDNLPPDEINILEDGKHYGWPACYGDRIYDSNFGHPDKNFCNKTVASLFDLPAHNAPLGLEFIFSEQFPGEWEGDLLVAFHGSWNRSVPDGYKVVRLEVDGNRIVGSRDFITGFISGGQAIGRPVDLEFDQAGNLFLSDDKAGVVYKVSKQ